MDNKKVKRKRTIKRVLICAFAILFLGGLFWYENHHLVVSHYTYENEKISDALDGYHIVQISDLHNATFGTDNQKLVQKIENLEPDCIVITGDIVDSHHTDINIAIQFVEKITSICPVYYVTGNHEYWLPVEERMELFAKIEAAGANILNNETVSVSVSEASFYLIGLDDNNLADGTLESLMKDCEEDALTVVLAHEPQYIENYSNAGADIVLSGHAHGGQFILPFAGAVVAPGQGLFPKYTKGRYDMGTTTMYVSRGLGNSIIPVRLFNDPEIVCLDLKKIQNGGI